MLDISKLPTSVLETIYNTLPDRMKDGERKPHVEHMSVHDAMDAYLSWNGIIGYTNQIMEAHNAIVEAQTAIPGQWTGIINIVMNRFVIGWDGIASVDMATAKLIIEAFREISFKVQYDGIGSAKLAQYSDFQRGLILVFNSDDNKVKVVLFEN